MNTYPHWTALLTAFLTIAIAALAAVIARGQWVTAKNKLKLDLFDRRMKVYEAAQALLSYIMRNGNCSDEELIKYTVAVREAKWLLNSSITSYLRKELPNKVIDLQALDAELKDEPVGEVRSKNVQERRVIKEWLRSQPDRIDEMCSEFLELRHTEPLFSFWRKKKF